MNTEKKPWYKRWKVWAGVVVAFAIIGAFTPDEVEPEVVAKVEAPEKVEVAASKTPEEIAEDAKAEEAAKAKILADLEAAEKVKAAEKAVEDKAKAETDAKKKAEKAEADAVMLESLQAIIDVSEGIVLDIKPSPYSNGDWATTWVVVSDAWYDSADHEKERFAESVGGAVKMVIGEDAALVHFYDAYDKELASEKIFGGYKIKR